MRTYDVISGKVYKDSTEVESFTRIYYDSDWTYIAFGSSGFWDTSDNTWGKYGGNILKFDTEPDGALLSFLQAHATPIDGGGGVTETDITSTVSAFNIDLILNGTDSVELQSTLGGGNGTYAATIEDTSLRTTPSVSGTTLTVNSSYSSNKDTSEHTNVIVTSGSKSLTIPVNISYQTCFTADTLITMFDGTTKRIDQIELGDLVLSLDKDGNKVPGYVYYCDSHCNHMGKHYDRFVFEDGTELKIVHRHRFYNMNEKKFVHLDLWYAGDEAYKLDGTTTALKETHLRDYEGDIPHYTLFCEHNTYFANGLLCGNRFSDPVDFNRGVATFSVDRKQYYPIVLTLPEVFSDCKDMWLDAETKDLMIKKSDGTVINYYQVGYDDSYATAYKKPSDDATIDLDTIESTYEKVAEIPHEAGTDCVDEKSFDIVVIYVKRTSRDNGIAVQSADGGGISPHRRSVNRSVNVGRYNSTTDQVSNSNARSVEDSVTSPPISLYRSPS